MNTSPNTARTEPRTAAEPATATASASTELRGTSSNKPLSIEKQTGADAPGCANPVEKSKSLLKDYRPITFKVVCAIARMVLLRRPAFDDSDWKEAVKVVAIKQGWEAPSSEMLARALAAVERAMAATIGPRAAAEPPVFSRPAPRQHAEWTREDYKALRDTLRSISLRTVAATQASVTAITRETLDISEPAALDQFYTEAAAGDRFGALRRFVEIAIVRPAEWDYGQVRAEASKPHRLVARGCFCCRIDRGRIHWHHVIQIQHGGSNYARNRVPLCERCHARVHPWLPQAKDTGGWTAIGDVVPTAVELMARFNRSGAA